MGKYAREGVAGRGVQRTDIVSAHRGEISLALSEVGNAATEIDVVAISVDPAGDTAAEVNRFSAVHDLTGRMSYIIGSRAKLARIWASWDTRAQMLNAIRSTHTAWVVLIDTPGREAGDYAGAIPTLPAALAADITTLVNS
jgi:cytochrome oxidase Cu insertion factor (SCO1/SenC/PrrC family)